MVRKRIQVKKKARKKKPASSPKKKQAAQAPPASPNPGAVRPVRQVNVACPNPACEMNYRVSLADAGKSIQCQNPVCLQVFPIPQYQPLAPNGFLGAHVFLTVRSSNYGNSLSTPKNNYDIAIFDPLTGQATLFRFARPRLLVKRLKAVSKETRLQREKEGPSNLRIGAFLGPEELIAATVGRVVNAANHDRQVDLARKEMETLIKQGAWNYFKLGDLSEYFDNRTSFSFSDATVENVGGTLEINLPGTSRAAVRKFGIENPDTGPFAEDFGLTSVVSIEVDSTSDSGCLIAFL